MGSRSFCPPPPPDWPFAAGPSPDGSGGHYVVACWGGARRKGGDPARIFRRHTHALEAVPHSLAQVTFCVPDCPGESPDFRELVRSLPARLGGARVRVLERPNRGLSYGSWSDALSVWRGCFPHHFLMEDDFVLCKPHFDREMVRILNESGPRGLLCGGVSECRTYADISNCLASDEALQLVWRANGGVLPHTPSQGYAADSAQSVFGQAFWRLGLPLHDLRAHYGVSFGEDGGARREWPHPAGWMMVSADHWAEMEGHS